MKIQNIGVLGTGTMGHGITQLCAQAGCHVNMYGRSDESLKRGFDGIKKDLALLISSKRISIEERDIVLSRINGVKTMQEACNGVQMIVECISENIGLKKEIFEQLDSICPKHVILASSTSGLSPSKIAEKTKNPERTLVAHFWNPPQLIPLVELVPGNKTSIETINNTMLWIESLGKKAVKMNKECPGFIGNRLQFALLREALYIVEQGYAEAKDVDIAVEYSLGRRLPVTGPLKSADLGGLDVFNSISSYLFKDLCNSREAFKMLSDKVSNKQFGTKSGSGIYDWTDDEIKAIKKKRNELLMYFLDLDENR